MLESRRQGSKSRLEKKSCFQETSGETEVLPHFENNTIKKSFQQQDETESVTSDTMHSSQEYNDEDFDDDENSDYGRICPSDPKVHGRSALLCCMLRSRSCSSSAVWFLYSRMTSLITWKQQQQHQQKPSSQLQQQPKQVLTPNAPQPPHHQPEQQQQPPPMLQINNVSTPNNRTKASLHQTNSIGNNDSTTRKLLFLELGHATTKKSHHSSGVEDRLDHEALIDFHVYILSKLLTNVLVKRAKQLRKQNHNVMRIAHSPVPRVFSTDASFFVHQHSASDDDEDHDQQHLFVHALQPPPTAVIDEVKEVLDWPQSRRGSMASTGTNSSSCCTRRGSMESVGSIDERKALIPTKPSRPTLAPVVEAQLKKYVTEIASRYQQSNAFHTFEHASHVTCSVLEMLQQILIANVRSSNSYQEDLQWRQELLDTYGVQRDSIEQDHNQQSEQHYFNNKAMHGLLSDPLLQFAVIFSALIHDVDHRGIPNTQLAKEQPEFADKYRNQSLAEQNSVDIAWQLLLSGDYSDLCECIFGTYHYEQQRFRQMVVNVVLATDICNPELKVFRQERWDKAFSNADQLLLDDDDDDDTNDCDYSPREFSAIERKRIASIAVDLIIQASDVSHTMQPWSVYLQWNERLFREMYSAYVAGRATKDPSDGWYEGEIFFFDKYVIPLAHKLEQTKVFGTSYSTALVKHATRNRDEWKQHGKELSAMMIKKFKNDLLSLDSIDSNDNNKNELSKPTRNVNNTTNIIIDNNKVVPQTSGIQILKTKMFRSKTKEQKWV